MLSVVDDVDGADVLVVEQRRRGREWRKGDCGGCRATGGTAKKGNLRWWWTWPKGCCIFIRKGDPAWKRG